MPHDDNRNWMSMLVGELPQAPPRLSLQDLIDSREMWDLSHLNQDLPSEVTRSVVDVSDGLTAELYAPPGSGPHPALLYMHGGGWCAGSAANERQIAMRMAAEGMLVANLEYRLAPEHPFPAALVDVVTALRWLSEHGEEHDARAGSLLLGGQSAGANLAAAATVAVTSDGGLHEEVEEALAGTRPSISGLVLMSGIYSLPLLLADPGSNIGPAELWHQAYLGPNFLRWNRHPLVSPALADLSEFPPCYLTCGDEDSLLGHTLEMTASLTRASVPTTVSVVAGHDHAFPFLEDRFDAIGAEMSRLRAWLVRTASEAGSSR